jgi:microcystin-dependent protein
MKKNLIGIILSTLAIFLLIFLFIQFKKTNDKIDNIEIPSHSHSPSASTGNGPSGLNETEVIELIRLHSDSGGGTTIIQESGADGLRNATSTELGYEVSLTGHNLAFNKNPIINSWSGMIVPFNVNFNTDEGKVQITELQRAGWFLCDGGNGDSEIPDLRGRFIWGGGSGLAYHHAEAQITNRNYNTFSTYGGTGVEMLSENQMPRHNHSSPIRDIGSCYQNDSTCLNGSAVTHLGNVIREATGGYLGETGYFDARHPETFDQSGKHTVGIGGGVLKDNGKIQIDLGTFPIWDENTVVGYLVYKPGKYTGGERKTDVEDRARGGPANGQPHNNLPPYVVMAYFIYLPHKAI